MRLFALMAPDVVRCADPAVLPEGGAVEVVGNRSVAEATRHFTNQIHASVPMLVNGAPAAVIAPGAHPLVTIGCHVVGQTIVRIEIARLGPTDHAGSRRGAT